MSWPTGTGRQRFGSVAGLGGGLDVPKKTRPPAEYDAHAALPCPDIEIGSRHPVAA
jgi:hypothetical protein